MTDELFDNAMKRAEVLFSTDTVNFLPYIGEKYDSAQVKILILGDSHYGDRDNPKAGDSYNAMTVDVIVNSFLKTGTIKCYSKQTKMLTRGLSSKSLWNRICFYNYFQRLVAPTSKSHIWLEQEESIFKKQAETAFFDNVLPSLSPDIVFVWGVYLRNKLPSGEIVADEDLRKIGCFRYSCAPDTIFFQLYHPSSVGDWDNDLPNVIKRWDKLIETRFPAVKELLKVEWLHKAVKDEFNGTFAYEQNENSFTARLYPFERGKYYSRSPNVMNLEVVFDMNDVKILFFTRNESLQNAVSLSEKIFSRPFETDGFNIVLWKSSGTISVDDLISKVKDFMNQVLVYRNGSAKHAALP